MKRPLSDLRGGVALVTGAASGIGRKTAEKLAEHGMRVIICDVNEAGLAETAQLVAARGECLLTRTVDVSNRAAMRAFADEVHALVPALDLLVNNAGVGLSGGMLTTPLEDWDWVLSVNLGGVIHGCHYFVPKMAERRRGHVVNVSSMLGYYGAPHLIGYATSKFAVYGLSESLRNELRSQGIGVSVICPGVIDTGIVKETRFRTGAAVDPEKLRERALRLYKQRNYQPERVADAILEAIRCNTGVVPVTPEAWISYGLSRISHRLSRGFGRLLSGGMEPQ